METAVASLLIEESPSRLADAARDLSDRYRAGYGSGCGQALTRRDALAYLGYRFPATRASAQAVFQEVHQRFPTFAPRCIVDVGAGLGSATASAVLTWPSLAEPAVDDGERQMPCATLFERDREMAELGARLFDAWWDEAGFEAARRPAFVPADLRRKSPTDQGDLVVASYALGELPPASRPPLLSALWQSAREVFIVIEPGTPAGWDVVDQARRELARLGCVLVAPVPADWPSLAAVDDWLHFSTRIQRSKLLRAVKKGRLGHEDEKFSYVVAARRPGVPFAARVIRHPQVRAGHIRVRMATATGTQDLVVTRSRKQNFRRARKLAWGDSLTEEELRALMDQ